MVRKIQVSIDGNMSEVYLIPQKGLVKVIGGGVISDRDYFSDLDQIQKITLRQLRIAHSDKNIEIRKY